MNVSPSAESDVQSFTSIVRGPYLISSRIEITDGQANYLVQTLRQGRESQARSVLGGRSNSLVCELGPLGRVFIKHYSHGGFFRTVTGGKFVGVGRCRAQVEFEMLEHVRAFGVNAPKPLAVIKKGGLVYSTWLVMEELCDTRTLVDIQRDEGERVQGVMVGLGEQLVTLIRHRVLHVDLHPGNVLVSPHGTVHIVDFDKAVHFRGGFQALRDLYLRRWRRAVIKHGLSPVLSEMMCLTLRSYNE